MIVYIGRETGHYNGYVFVTTKKKEGDFLNRYHGMELNNRTQWNRRKITGCRHSVHFVEGDGMDRWLDCE